MREGCCWNCSREKFTRCSPVQHNYILYGELVDMAVANVWQHHQLDLEIKKLDTLVRHSAVLHDEDRANGIACKNSVFVSIKLKLCGSVDINRTVFDSYPVFGEDK